MGSPSDSRARSRIVTLLASRPKTTFVALALALSLVLIGLVGYYVGQPTNRSSDTPIPTERPPSPLPEGSAGLIEYNPVLLGPQENYTAPQGAVVINPEDDANAIIAESPANTKFWFTAGVHRGVTVENRDLKDGMEFHGAYGAVLNGAEVVTGWTQQSSRWRVNRSYESNELEFETDECLSDYPRCAFLSDLYLDDEPLKHVDTIGAVNASGLWHYDVDDGVIYMWDNPIGGTVELSATTWAISTGEEPSNPADDVVVKNLIIEKYASLRQRAAVHGSGSSGWIVENCDIRLNGASGVRTDDDMTVRNNRLNWNGQQGITGHGVNVLVEGNEIAWNNYAGYDPEWEAGGSKFVGTTNLVCRHNYVHDNNGAGLWADISNDNVLFEYNVTDRNELPGLYLEISYSGVIRYNLSRDNYYSGVGAGILISTAGPAEVYGNEVLVAESRDGVPTHGIHVINADRDEPWDYEYTRIYDNKIALVSANSDAVVWWLEASKPSSQGVVESCNASQDHNSYYIPTGHSEAIFKRPSLSNYDGEEANLSEIRAFCGFEQNGRVTQVADPAAALTGLGFLSS